MRVSIHQPNYLPWIGLFNKIKNSDVFVVFDDVQLPTGKNFETRTSIKSPNGKLDLNIPIFGRGEKPLIKDALIVDNGWREKHLKSIRFAYSKAPNFYLYEDEIEGLYIQPWNKLLDFNVAAIKLLAKFLEIKTKIILSSQISSENLAGEAKILDICKKLKATEYISGNGKGSMRYVVGDDFKKAGINLIWQDFEPKVYPQLWGEFTPRLSALDLILNCGPESVNLI